MFGHAFKDQRSGLDLLKRFKNDGGKLYDLEYLLDDTGKRVAAFGYWAGFAGAAVSVKVWLCQKLGKPCNGDIRGTFTSFYPLAWERLRSVS